MNYLFSNKFKKIGWALFGIGILLGIVHLFVEESPSFLDVTTFSLIGDTFVEGSHSFSLIQNNILDEISALFIIVGGLFAAFSKEKYEDEFISKIRLESLVWATYFNYGILLLSVLFVYGLPFFWILMFNMFTTLIIFLVKFNIALGKIKKN